MRILTINTGSSSVKAALYDMGAAPRALLTAKLERIGRRGGSVSIRDAVGAVLEEGPRDLPDFQSALRLVLSALPKDEGLDVVGHRVVHGGREYSRPQLVDRDLLATLRDLISIDPAHLPQAIEAIDTVAQLYPSVPQVACFDTAFHRRMPPVAQRYALPYRLGKEGIIRYGFHGLSCESIMHQLQAVGADGGRVVIAHLGNGTSMTAVLDGISVDTSMGFTPTGGLVMGTRSGDLDPGVLIYLLRSEGMDAAALSDLVNRQSGLLGVSGLSADMHDLLAAESTNARAAEAIELFCYTARKYLGGLATVLGGLDTLVFTGGIGEHAVPVRERICAPLGYLGIHPDEERNRRGDAIISSDGSAVTVRVMATDEDAMIAGHTATVMREREGSELSV